MTEILLERKMRGLDENQAVEIPPSDGKRVAKFNLSVRGRLDQTGAKWLRVKFRGDVAFATLKDLITEPSRFYGVLSRQGVIILEPALRTKLSKLAQDALFKKRIYVVDRLGWHAGHYFAPGRRNLPDRIGGVPVVNILDASEAGWDVAGDPEVWKREVARLTSGQDLLVFLLGAAFLPLLSPLTSRRDDNIGIEIVGPTSIGKTSAVALPASVYGAPKKYGTTWHTTANALEPTMRLHTDGLLVLDEMALFASGGQTGKDLAEVIFKLTAGSEKARFDRPAPHQFPFLYMSTSNQRASVLANCAPALRDALDVRLLSIPAYAGKGYGIFDSVPDGSLDSADAISQLARLLSRHHGGVARELIAKVEEVLANRAERRKARRLVRSYKRAFRKEALALTSGDGEMQRRVQSFASIYAALRIARDWGIIAVRSPRKAVLAIFRRHLSLVVSSKPPAAKTAEDLIHDYIRKHKGNLHDIDRKVPNLTDQELDSADGFLRTIRGRRWLLIRRIRWEREFGQDSAAILGELSAAKLLWATEGLQRQEKVRQSKKKDRVYCIEVR